MGLFSNVKSSTKTEKVTDRVGGFVIHETGVYEATLRRMYASKADSGSLGVTLELDLFTDPNSDKTTRMTKTIYVTNSEGENFFISQKDNKQYMNSGWLMIDAIANFATDGEAGLAELETEEVFIKRTVDGQETTVTVEGYPEVADLSLNIGLMKVNKPVSKKVDGKWVDTEEMRDENEIERIFNEEGFTFLEWEANQLDAPEFINKWEKEWKGKTKTIKPKVAKTSRTAGGRQPAARGGAARGAAAAPARATGRPSRFTR